MEKPKQIAGALAASFMRRRRTPLTQARELLELSAYAVAIAIGIDTIGLLRIERGQYIPRRERANALWGFYGGILPLGMIYEPTHHSFVGWLTDAKKKALIANERRRQRAKAASAA